MVQRWDIEGECSNVYCPVKVEKDDGGDFVEFDDYATLAAVTKKLLESMRTGVQLSFKELGEIERMLK